MIPWIQRQLLNAAYGKPREATGPFDPNSVKKVLMIRRNGIGDMICALPLLRNIRTAWPEVQLDVMAGPKNSCILENLNLVNHIYLYERGSGIYRNHYFNLPQLLKPIHQQQYDLLIIVKGGFSSLLAVIAHATRIPWRLGYVPSRGHSLDFCFNLKVELPREREHQVESCLRLLEPLAISKKSCDLSFKLETLHHQYVDELLKQHKLTKTKFVLINLSSDRYESRWLPTSIAQIATELDKQFSLPTILCGLPRDRSSLRLSQNLAPEAIRAFIEPPTIHHFGALTQSARFLLCSDGGPMHVAAAMKTPVCVLFSATDPRIWRPYHVPFAYIQKGRFVSDISPGEVLTKLQEWLPSF